MKNRQEISQEAQEQFNNLDSNPQLSKNEIKALRKMSLDLISEAIEVYKNQVNGLDNWELNYLASAINDLRTNMTGHDSIIWLRKCLKSIELSATEISKHAELFPDSPIPDTQTLEEAIKALEAQLATQ